MHLLKGSDQIFQDKYFLELVRDRMKGHFLALR